MKPDCATCIGALTELTALTALASPAYGQTATTLADAKAPEPFTTLNAHVGRQEYKGGNGFSNGDTLNYTDWKLGLTWFVNGWNLGAYYTDTNAKDAGYTLASRNIGKATGTVFVQKTF